MKPEAQRIAIAEAHGWRIAKVGGQWHDGKDCWAVLSPSGQNMASTDENEAHWLKWGYLLPDYLHDLNAMHEAEKVLTLVQRIQYADILYNKTGKDLLDWSGVYYPGEEPSIDLEVIYLVINSNSAQRAEAFLLTINKWTED